MIISRWDEPQASNCDRLEMKPNFFMKCSISDQLMLNSAVVWLKIIFGNSQNAHFQTAELEWDDFGGEITLSDGRICPGWKRFFMHSRLNLSRNPFSFSVSVFEIRPGDCNFNWTFFHWTCISLELKIRKSRPAWFQHFSDSR